MLRTYFNYKLYNFISTFTNKGPNTYIKIISTN